MAKGLRFNFVGEIDANKMESKVPFLREITNEKGKVIGYGLNLTSIAEKNNRAFMECAGFKNDTIKTYNTDDKEIEIDWDDRFNTDVVDSVANYRKNVLVLDNDRHEFVSTYDFIKFISENIDDIKDKRFAVTGRVKKNVYKGNISDRFEIQSLYEIGEDDDRKNALKVMGEFYFNKESFDFADWKKEQKIIIDGFTREYIDKEHSDVFVAKQLILDGSKLDLENDKHVKMLQARLLMLGCAYDADDNTITCKCKKNKWYATSVVTTYINGNEEVEFDESQLTELQKTYIELGMKTLDDFKPKGNVYGDRVVVYKIIDFNLTGDYANGIVLIDSDELDVDDNIYVAPKNEKLEDVEDKMDDSKKSKKSSKKAEKEEEKEELPFEDDDDDDDDPENLFA